jgi:hypothetical protein
MASMRNAAAVTALSLALLACNAVIPPTPTRTSEAALTSTSTPEPTPSRTALTETSSTRWKPVLSALPPLRVTLGPTLTPAAASTPHPSFRTAAAPVGLACRLDWKSPGNGYELDPDEIFSAGWKLTNTGVETWTQESVVFTYVSGAQLHNDAVVQLDRSVPTGSSVILSVRMRAPEHSALYTTYWSLRQGDVFFCRVSVTIYVD